MRDNLTAVIDNLGELKSSVVAGEELKTDEMCALIVFNDDHGLF